MSIKHILPLAMGVVLTLAGCGTYVPNIQENPWSYEAQRLVQAITGSINCEIRKAVFNVITSNTPEADWLKSWGAQVQIQLTIDESSAFSPSGLYSPIHIFFLSLGGNVSSDATRIDTVNYYYSVNDILKANLCNQETIENLPNHPIGSLLIRSDLKLEEWLASVVTSHATGDIPVAKPTGAPDIAKNSLQHEIKFQVVTSGNITPKWMLKKAVINPTGSLLMASRTRTHDLQITFGPNVSTKDLATGKVTESLGIGTPSANASLAAQIGLSISNHLTTNSLP